MGGQQSSRRISVENENTIQLSKETIERIQSHRKQHQSDGREPELDYEPSFESAQRRYSERASEEAYWARRIEKLRRAHHKISAGAQLEYERTLKQANELFERAHDDRVVGKLPPCQDEQSKVVQCYKANPNQSLMCSVLVKSFNECVCNSRVSAVAAAT